MGVARRIGLAVALVLVITALLAVLVVRSRAGAADAADCGPLPAAPGAAVDGVSAVLHGLPAAVTTSQHITATMVLTAAEPTTIEFAAGASADLVLVDDRGDVVGSGNYAHNANGDTSHPVDEGGLAVAVFGEAYACVELDDPAVTAPDDTERPLASGDYRAAAVLSTAAGDLVTPLVPIRVG